MLGLLGHVLQNIKDMKQIYSCSYDLGLIGVTLLWYWLFSYQLLLIFMDNFFSPKKRPKRLQKAKNWNVKLEHLFKSFLDAEASLARTTCPVNDIKLVRPKLGVNPRFHFMVAQAWRLAVGSWQQVCKLLFTAVHLPPGTFEWSHNLAVLPSLQCAFENYDLWRL